MGYDADSSNHSNKTMKLKICKLHENAVVPTYATDGSACFDLAAATVAGYSTVGKHVEPNAPITCGTGLAFEVPQGHVMLVFSRSGHGFKNGVRLSNCVGVIDSDYRGELLVQLTQDDRLDGHGYDLASTFIKPGERVAQAMVLPVQQVSFEVAEQLSITDRGMGGLGSTGK